jgi:hypothetical protein
MEFNQWIKPLRSKINLFFLVIIGISILIYHFLIFLPYENKRDETKYQTCINKVHLSFQKQWTYECKKMHKEDSCGLDNDIASKLERWRQDNNNICVVALSWSK